MNDIEKINEELRNYKLFKIQRALTREQEFKRLRDDLIKIRKNNVVNYLLVSANVIAVLLFIYQMISLSYDYKYFQENKVMLGLNFLAVIVLSVYVSWLFFQYNRKLHQHIKTSENAVEYFKTEGENLKSAYETYVDNFLNKK